MKQILILGSLLVSTTMAATQLSPSTANVKRCKVVIEKQDVKQMDCVSTIPFICWSTYHEYTMKLNPNTPAGDDNCWLSFQDYGNFYFEGYSKTCPSPHMDASYRSAVYLSGKDAFNSMYTYDDTGKISSNECGPATATEVLLPVGGTIDMSDKCDAYIFIKKWTNFTSSNCAEWTIYGNMHATYMKGAVIASVGALLAMTNM